MRSSNICTFKTEIGFLPFHPIQVVQAKEHFYILNVSHIIIHQNVCKYKLLLADEWKKNHDFAMHQACTKDMRRDIYIYIEPHASCIVRPTMVSQFMLDIQIKINLA